MTRVLGVAAAVIAGGAAAAQVSSHPEAQSPLEPNPYLSHHEPWRWDLTLQVFLRGGTLSTIDPEGVDEYTLYFELDAFEFILPVMRDGGFFWAPKQEIETWARIESTDRRNRMSVTRLNETQATLSPQLLMAPSSGAVYGRISERTDLGAIQSMHFKQVNRVVSADTRFDERLAREIPWPDAWPPEAELALTPVVERVRNPIVLEGQDRLCELVDRWTKGQDPRSIDQVTLVKFLTGKVLDHVRVGRGKSETRPNLSTRTNLALSEDEGVLQIPRGVWSGLNVRSADLIALEPRLGSVLDLSTMLTGVLRAAGVPARLVICYDTSDEIDQLDRIVSLVEFALHDPDLDQLMWIPIDTERLRDSGRGVSSYQQPWLYFGTHDELHELVPVARHFHPPVNYRAFGFPAFFGFRSSPELGSFATQHLMMDAGAAPVSGHDYEKKPTNP